MPSFDSFSISYQSKMLLYLALNLSVDLILVCLAPVYWICSLWKKGLLSVKGHSFIFASFCKEYFAVHGEYADRHKIERISTNFCLKPKKNQILSNLSRHYQLGKKTISRYCPFNSCICSQSKVLLAIWLLSIKGAFFAVDWALHRVLNNSQSTMLSRGRMIWLLGHPLHPSLVSKLGQRHTGKLRKRDNLLTGEEGGEGVGRGAESSDRKKGWSSINPALLSGPQNSQSVTSWLLDVNWRKKSDSSEKVT
jgi:hypothetical protein